MKPTIACRRLILGGLLFSACSTTHGQITWTGATDSLWTQDANWNPASVPTAGANVVFDGTGSNLDTNFNGTSRTLGSLSFTSAQTDAVGITTTNAAQLNLGPTSGAGPFTVLDVAAGSHKFTGTNGGTGSTADLRFLGTTGTTFVLHVADSAVFDINGRIVNNGGTASNRTFQKTGGGTLVLSADNGGTGAWQHSAGGGFQIQEGALRLAANNAGGNSANSYTVSSGAALELSGGFNQNVNNGTYTLNGTGIGNGGALRSLGGNNSVGGSGTGGISLASDSSIGVDSGNLTISQLIKGSFGLTKVGEGTLILNSTGNSYTGTTTISAGTLEVRHSIASSAGIINQSALVHNLAADQSYGNAISGSGTLTKQGAGMLTLSANNSYSGATTVSQGVLQIGAGGTTGTLGANSATSIAAGAELRINRSTDGFGYSYSGQLSGSGTVSILAARRFNFQNNNQTASGDLSFVIDGTLAINTGSGVTAVHLGELSGSGTIQRAGTAPTNPPLTVLTIGGKNTDSTFAGTITNIAEFSLRKVGSGTFTLAGSSGHGGPTNIDSGTLALASTGTIANSSTIHVASGATFDVSAVTTWTLASSRNLTGSGNIIGNATIAGNLMPGTSPGVLSFANDLTLAGTAGTTLEILGPNRGTDHDGIDVAGAIAYGGSLTLELGTTFLPGSHSFQLFDLFTGISGSFDSVNLTGSYSASLSFDSGVWSGSTNSGAEIWSFSQDSGSLSLTVIPEPASLLLGSLGLLAWLRRRRN